jgi:hypothetical protein
MKTRTITTYLLIVVLAAPIVMAKQRREPAEVWRLFAERLEVGAFVRIRLIDHKQVKGHFVGFDGDVLHIKPKTRVPVPIRDLQFPDIESIERQKEGWSPGTKVLTGVGVGTGIVLLVAAAILAAAWD